MFFLQETYSTPDVIESWKYQWSGDMFRAHGTNHSKGVLILINKTIQFTLESIKQDSGGRFVLIEALVQDCPMALLNIYAPNNVTEAIEFFQNIQTIISDFDQNRKLIIGGDFNVHVPLNLQQDSYGSKAEKKGVVEKFQDIILASELIDIWRIRNPDKRSYTWRQKRPLIQRRLDYWLISDDLQDDIENARIIPSIKTDHLAITLEINSIEKQPPGPSYWKLNASLLEDIEYIELIKNLFSTWIEEFSEVQDKRLLWDLVKYRIRQVSIKFGKDKAKKRRNKLTEIELSR